MVTKYILALSILLLVLLSSVARLFAQHIPLVAGESYTVGFNSLDYVGPAPEGGFYGPDARVLFTNDVFDVGDSVIISLFENSITNVPFREYQFTTSFPRSSLEINTASTFYWQNFQGVVRIKVLTGSVNVYAMLVSNVKNFGLYAKRLDFPTLQISTRKTDSGLVLSWPTNAPGLTLQSSFDFGMSNSWANVTNALTINNEQFTVTNSISTSSQFYRLKK